MIVSEVHSGVKQFANTFEKTQLVQIYFVTQESFGGWIKTRAASFYDVHHPSRPVSGHLTAFSSQTNKDQTPLSGWATHKLNARYSTFQEKKILHYSLLYRNARVTGVEPILNLTVE